MLMKKMGTSIEYVQRVTLLVEVRLVRAENTPAR